VKINLNDTNETPKDRGRIIGYTDKECVNCGRLRVELWENGDKICEKCNWNQEKEEYEHPNY
jgi:ribosomal protein L37AE/L43A